MNYKLIKKFLPELKIRIGTAHCPYTVVIAKDLEAELAKGVEVFGDEPTGKRTTTEKYEADTHSGLLIGYKPIQNQEPVSREEIIDIANELNAHLKHAGNFIGKDRVDALIERIKKNGVR